MSEDFVYVSRTKKKSRRNRNRAPETATLASIQERFENSQLTFRASEFSSRCTGIIHPLDNLIVAAFQELIGSVCAPERIVCLGLGSLVEGEAGGKRISEVQLALLLDLRKLINVPS